MAASGLGRSLYVGLKADTKGFGKSLSAAERRMKMFKNTAKVIGTAVAASFAAMGAAALLFGKSAITAALEDQKSQVLLAKTIKNNAKNRKGLIKDSEKTISALESQYNIIDDKLRPAFGKLVVATKSVSKSQKIIRTAIDVSALSGKSLDTVVTALSKAYLGSNTALGKLGLGIDKTKLKTMSFDQLLGTLAKKTGGSGKAAAGTYQGAVDGLSIAWQNFQESVGYKILPKLGQLLKYIKTNLIPFLSQVKAGFDGIAKDKNSPAAKLGIAIKNMTLSFQGLFTSLSGQPATNGISVLEQMAGALTTVANAISAVTNAIAGSKRWWRKWGALIGTLTGADPGNYGTGPAPASTRAPVVPSERFVTPNRNIKPSSYSMSGKGTTIINLNGIVDAESARRSIEQLLQKSSIRTGAVSTSRTVWSA